MTPSDSWFRGRAPVDLTLLVLKRHSLPKEAEISGVTTFHGATLNLLNAWVGLVPHDVVENLTPRQSAYGYNFGR